LFLSLSLLCTPSALGPLAESVRDTKQTMNIRLTNKILNIFIATVWLVNGLFCKVLNQVQRHEEIVRKILHLDRPSANIFTILIGLSETMMAIWILSRYKHKFNAIAQIAIIAIMNILEFLLVPDILLWGKLNSFFALLFILLIYYNEFVLNKEQNV
jgi:uncharacterized membrane protein YphA (DoxX/SURF4 family)